MNKSNQWIESTNRTPKRPKKTSKTTAWGVLGRSGGALGPLLGALGPSWDGLGGHLGSNTSQDWTPSKKLSNSLRFWGRFWLPKWRPKRPQDDPKTSQKSRRNMHDFLIALGPVLDRSWGHLGPILGSKKWLSPYVFQCFLNIVIFEQVTVQDAFLIQLDPIWAPKRVPKGAQDEPKMDPRRVQNQVQNRFF